MKKKLLIKANGITNARKNGVFSGVGRSTHKLLSTLNNLDDIPFEIEVYVDGKSSIGFDFYGWKFPHFIFPIPVSWGNEKTSIEPLFRKYFVHYDLLHIPHNDDWVYEDEKFVVTMHDVFDYDMAIERGDNKIIEKWRRMALQSKAIMTCSEHSKHEILKRFEIPDNKITVVYWGTSTDLFYINKKVETERCLRELCITGNYFFSVSCAHRRKNIRTLLSAYRKFRETWLANNRRNCSHKLVLVWNNPPEDILNAYSKEIESGQIVFLPAVTDKNLRALYCGATCTMFPTLAEGFGFPILESFACGTPIMTCRNSSLTEVGRDTAIYVGERDIDEMVAVMTSFEKGEYDTRKFLKESQEIVNSFTWEKTAQGYIDFYKKYL